MDVFNKEAALVKAQYPALGDGWKVEMSGWSIDELCQSSHEINDRYQHLTNEEGFFPESAMETAVTEAMVKVEAPKGYHFVRLVKEGQTALLLLIKLP